MLRSVPLSRSNKSFNIKLVMQMLRGKNWKMRLSEWRWNRKIIPRSLEKRVNKKVMTMFEKAEDEYNDLLFKKNIIESKIKKVIEELDEEKKETLKVSWVKVNK